jgi:hypothetical protein
MGHVGLRVLTGRTLSAYAFRFDERDVGLAPTLTDGLAVVLAGF